MSGVTGIDNNSVLRELTARPEAEEKDDKQIFLELMIAQMENQDPLNPQEGGEFLAQLASFSTVEGIEKLNLTMEGMAGNLRSSQALQATSLVGRSVMAPGDIGTLTEEQGMAGVLELPFSSSQVRVDIFAPSGELVQQMNLGSRPGGDNSFYWDGRDSSGEQRAAGEYRVEAHALLDGENNTVPTRMAANVNSVTIGGEGEVTLNVAGVGPIRFQDISEIQ